MRGGKVMVHQFADGRLRFFYKERALTCTAYGTYSMPDPAEDEKILDVRVEAIIVTRYGGTNRPLTRAVCPS
jgi:hypothetical protein